MNFSAARVLPLAVSAVAIFSLGASYVPNLPLPPNSAMIYNAGSGDYSGYRIVVMPDGRAISIDGAGHGSTQLQGDVVEKFFGDLADAGPLAQLGARPCTADLNAPTTVEVNSSIVITWKGQRTPALTCAADPSAQRLLLDATQIQHALYVQAYRKRNLATYGTPYEVSNRGYAANAAGGYNGISFDNFYAGGLSNQRLLFDPFTTEHFSAELYPANPFYVGSPFTGLPYASLPYATLPTAGAFTSLPYATLPYASLYSGSVYTSNPFVNPGFTSPYSGSGPYTTSVP